MIISWTMYYKMCKSHVIGGNSEFSVGGSFSIRFLPRVREFLLLKSTSFVRKEISMVPFLAFKWFPSKGYESVSLGCSPTATCYIFSPFHLNWWVETWKRGLNWELISIIFYQHFVRWLYQIHFMKKLKLPMEFTKEII